MSAFEEVNFKEKEYIYTDTSALLQFLGYDNDASKRRNVASLFAEAYNSNAPLVVSEIVFDEILNVIIKDAFKNADCKNQHDIKRLKETAPDTYCRVLGQALNDYKSYKRKVLTNDAFLPDILSASEETRKIRDQMMETYNIFGSNDAMHLAIAREYGIEYFVTTDSDFRNISIPDLQIICIDESDTK
ncbi:MAG: type II toxin-antitoxin system VapC family toxin [Anaerovoracaceae bacterium]